MKRYGILLMVSILFFSFGNLQGQLTKSVKSRSSRVSAKKDSGIIEQLHQVMAPAWHNAYPDKDHQSLRDAIKKFNSMIPDLQKAEPDLKTPGRKEKFDKARGWFIKLVDQGKRAIAADDDESLYDLIPDLHASFEEMAYCLHSIQFPEYESFKVVVDLMIDTHLKNKDFDAVKSSMGALTIKNEMLQKAATPPELKSVDEAVQLSVVTIGKICIELDSACRSENDEAIEKYLLKLDTFCKEFEKKFL